MRKNVIVLFFLLVCLTIMPLTSYAGPNVVVDGKILQTDVPPVMQNDRIYVPIRPIFEAMGFDVKYYSGLELVSITTPDRSIMLDISLRYNTWAKPLNSSEFKPITPPPIVYQDRTMVPLRFVATLINCSVNWDDTTETAYINTNTSQPAQSTAQDLSGQIAAMRAQKIPSKPGYILTLNGRIYNLIIEIQIHKLRFESDTTFKSMVQGIMLQENQNSLLTLKARQFNLIAAQVMNNVITDDDAIMQLRNLQNMQ